jgi:DNA-binding NarL/FixJ family response regulator
MLGRQRETSALAELTPREHEVLGLLAQGCSNEGVARRIFITQRAVEKHVTAIMSKLDLPPEPEAHRRVLAVLAYLDDARAGAARAGAS